MEAYQLRNGNPINRRISEHDIHKIFRKFKIDAKVNNISNYYEAFVHESYVAPTSEILEKEPPLTSDEIAFYKKNVQEVLPFQNNSYDRLEFIGDRVLDLIIADYIFHRYPDEAEGFWTELKTKLVRGSRLCILAKKLRLDRFILVSRKYDKYRRNDDVLEDVFEAFLGAIYRDFGCHTQAFGICKDFVVTLMERYLNFTLIVRRQDNYKRLLLEYYHKHFGAGKDPKYVTQSFEGPSNDRLWKSGVTNIDGFVIATGEARTSTGADQMAAKEALKYYGVQELYSDSEEPIKEVYSDSDSESLTDNDE